MGKEKDNTSASVAMVASIPELIVSEQVEILLLVVLGQIITVAFSVVVILSSNPEILLKLNVDLCSDLIIK